MGLLSNKNEEARKAVHNVLVNYLQANDCRRLWCFTDNKRKWLAENFIEVGRELGLRTYLTTFSEIKYTDQDIEPIKELLNKIDEDDLMISIFSHDISKVFPTFKVFPVLKAPKDFKGKSASIRSHFPDQLFAKRLLTPLETVEETVAQVGNYQSGDRLRVTAPAGTDLTFELKNGKTLPYKIDDNSNHAYLPASEVTYGIKPGTARGKIVVDVTVGEFVVKGQLVDQLGEVDSPVTLTVEDGYITGIEGQDIAGRLETCFEEMEEKARLVVELGFGLSTGQPFGWAGTDEILQGTCHFGIGNDFFYGGNNDVPMHLDVIIQSPEIEELKK